jgi:hypothetical protein
MVMSPIPSPVAAISGPRNGFTYRLAGTLAFVSTGGLVLDVLRHIGMAVLYCSIFLKGGYRKRYSRCMSQTPKDTFSHFHYLCNCVARHTLKWRSGVGPASAAPITLDSICHACRIECHSSRSASLGLPSCTDVLNAEMAE